MSRHLLRLVDDPYLAPFRGAIENRSRRAAAMEQRLTGGQISLADFASAHEYFGLRRQDDQWIFREWAPNASAIWLIGDFSQWKRHKKYALKRINNSGHWEIILPEKTFRHGDLYRLYVEWPGGGGDRVPAFTRRVVQDPTTLIFNAQAWAPEPYRWRVQSFKRAFNAPLIYETHVGMAQEKEGVGTYREFTERVIPRIVDAGYNTIQLMAIMEHPYYGSFGYHVSSFFAASSRFGTPEELKDLIDTAHEAGLAVIMDIVHSHAVMNEVEGISRFDGTTYQYFHDGPRGTHVAWNSRCFDYAKTEVAHFLLSNCRYWLDEFHFDGFRFDGVTSMLYYDHGLGEAFTSYDKYFDGRADEDAAVYLVLANKLIHELRPDAMTIAEDVSGMPGLGAAGADGGFGFDYRMAMGVPDHWFHLVRKKPDEHWDVDILWHELTNHRADEKTISYMECHDQAIVGDKTFMFHLADAAMYWNMNVDSDDMTIARAMALHKMARLLTFATADFGYLNFMGNEFGHPEWIDFPRDGNGWSYKYARRQWCLRDDAKLKYRFLAEFDKAMTALGLRERLMESDYPKRCFSRRDDQVLAFERAGYFFVFNFHPTRSLTDYAISAPPGRYRLMFHTDETRFGGHARLTPDQIYEARPCDGHGQRCRFGMPMYLPCRTALVLKQI